RAASVATAAADSVVAALPTRNCRREGNERLEGRVMCANSLVVSGQRAQLAQNRSRESIELRYRSLRSHYPRREMSASLRAHLPKITMKDNDTSNAIADGLGRPGRLLLRPPMAT